MRLTHGSLHPHILKNRFLTPLITTPKRQGVADLCEFMASLVYIVKSDQPGLHTATLSQTINQIKIDSYFYFLKVYK